MSLLKRLEQVIKYLSASGARTVVLKVPTEISAVEGSLSCTTSIAPETEAGIAEILEALSVTDADFVIQVSRYYEAIKPNGSHEPEPIPTPQLISVT